MMGMGLGVVIMVLFWAGLVALAVWSERRMKTVAVTLGAAALAVALVGAGAWLGANWSRNQPGIGVMGYGMMGGGRTGMPFGSVDDMPCDDGWRGSGTMNEYGACPGAFGPSEGEAVTSAQDAREAVEAYLHRLGYQDLHVTEVMEFQRNFYAIAAEDDTGIGAMELLVERGTGLVGPEPGPNMMWNTAYGMHRGDGMMGGYANDEMTLSPEEAEEAAQRWLDANLPGRTAGEADPFYGYYTLHFLSDDEIEGMLSVHGGSGQVWYHSWHGDFIAMTGDHD